MRALTTTVEIFVIFIEFGDGEIPLFLSLLDEGRGFVVRAGDTQSLR